MLFRSPGQAWLALALLLAALCGSTLPNRAQAGSAADEPDARRIVPTANTAAAEGDLDVTTDSAEYCDRLRLKLAAYANPPRIVQELRAEGEQMCREGRIRGGIARLRRALLTMRDEH